MATPSNSVNLQTGTAGTLAFHNHLRSASGQWHRYNDTVDTHGYYSGVGSPEGVVAADIGSIYTDTGVAANGIYYKTTDTVNTGWVRQISATTGVLVKSAFTTLATTVVTSTIIPPDDTIPQITEGASALTLAYTALSATNNLRVEVYGWGHTGASNMIGALFVQPGPNAFVADYLISGTGIFDGFYLSGTVVAGTTAAQTFEFRFGPQAAIAAAINGSTASAHFFGAAGRTYMTISEYLP